MALLPDTLIPEVLVLSKDLHFQEATPLTLLQVIWGLYFEDFEEMPKQTHDQ